ncbi:bifunctional hydroxymethylpyrimidine kinase/phosphomethylpyrimidine kinase, partial [Vibrio parahaemolyticus]
PSAHTHGTGCTLSAAVAALLAKGVALLEAVARAKRFVTRAIETAPGIGQGIGPLNHWAGEGADGR